MAKNTSLIWACVLDGEGGARQLDWNQVNEWQPEHGVLWLHVNYTKSRAIQWLNRRSGINKLVVKEMVSQESRPRAEIQAQGILVMLRGMNLNPGADPEDMISLRAWLEPQRVITTGNRRLHAIDEVRQLLETGLGPKNSSELFLQLNDCVLNRIATAIDMVEDRVNDLEERIVDDETESLRALIADLRRQSISIRRYLAPQRDALARLHSHEGILFSKTERQQLHEATERVIRYIEDLDSARERAAITHEELNSHLSEQSGRRMYFLSVVAVIFLPLTFITGLLGINVGGIPGADFKWAFAIVCAALLALCFLIVGFLRVKKWM